MRTSKSLTPILLAVGAAALLGACGDDSGGTPDARPADASTTPDANTTPDGPPPPPPHTGTIAVTEVELTSPMGRDLGIKGAAVSIAFENPAATGGGEVLFGTSPPLNTCLVKKYTRANPEKPATNEGEITFSGTGLLKPLGKCNFAEGRGYECVVDNGTSSITVTRIGGTAHAVTIANKDLTTVDVVGSWIRLAGFAATPIPDTDPQQIGTYNGTHPIVAKAVAGGNTTLTVLMTTPLPPSTAPETVEASVWSILGGFGPIPTANPFSPNVDFLTDDSGDKVVTVTKAAQAGGVGALNNSLPPAGSGFDIADDAVGPEEFPFTAQAFTLTCGASCGNEPAASGARLQLLAISGRTTDVPLPTPSAAVPDFFMPPAAAATTYATFQCTFFKNEGNFSATIPQEAVAAILSTNPTRIETRVFRFTGEQLLNSTVNYLVGHGQVGHASRPQAQ